MKAKSVGIDLEEVKRFSEKKYESNISFYEKIFTNNEIDYCLKKSNPYPHFTARFCAKEAAIKALKKKVALREVEVVVVQDKPELKLPFNQEGLLSISHTNQYALALVIL